MWGAALESAAWFPLEAREEAPRPKQERQVHLWRWSLDGAASEGSCDLGVLSVDERERAARFRRPVDRHRFVAARAQLRRILAAYLGCEAEAVRFGYGPAGKPFSRVQPEGWRLAFSLSHSEALAALAVAEGGEIGLDIERVRDLEPGLEALILSPAEIEAAHRHPGPVRSPALLVAWTRKEACLKAQGTGLQTPPTAFEFSQDGGPALLRVEGSAEEARRWQVLDLAPAIGFVGALATRQPWPPITVRWMEPDQALERTARAGFRHGTGRR